MSWRLPAMLPILALLTAACAMPPPTPRSPSSTIGHAPIDADELALESQRLRERAKSHLEEQQRRVERVGQRLLATIPDHPKVRFVVVQGDPSINAGATFGEVAVTSGMLNFVRSDDEMAVVLGHELAHIEQGHVLKGTIGNLALGILATVIEAKVPGAGQAAGGIGQLFLNHYTQGQEREADEIGLRYAYEAGYDPRAAEKMQERLAVEEPQSMTAGYFDTHPSSVERAVAARKEAEELLSHGPPPGRAEALALERRDETARMAAQDRRAGQGFAAARAPRQEPEPRDQTQVPPRVVDECRRARVYVEMAQDARDPDEKKDLYRRALRYCPTLTEARRGLESTEPGEGGAAPFDTY
jgi:Zn-dependent protease with chaperone function